MVIIDSVKNFLKGFLTEKRYICNAEHQGVLCGRHIRAFSTPKTCPTCGAPGDKITLVAPKIHPLSKP